MAILTVTERLEAIETAITAAEKAVEVGTGSKRLMRERLSTLYRERRKIYAEYLEAQNATTGGFFNKAQL